MGKTFQNDDRRVVVVDSIDHDPMMRQEVIVLTVDDLNDLFPAEPVNGSGLARRGGMMAPGLVNRPGSNGSQGAIQVVSANGQNVFTQTSMDWESVRMTCGCHRCPRQASPRKSGSRA